MQLAGHATRSKISVLKLVFFILSHEAAFLTCSIGIDDFLKWFLWFCCHWALAWGSKATLSEIASRAYFHRLFSNFFHFSQRTLCVIFERLDAIHKLFHAQTCISIEVHSSDDSDEECITGIDAAFNKEALKVWSIDKLKVAVIYVEIKRVQVIVVSCGEILLQHFILTSQGQFFLK